MPKSLYEDPEFNYSIDSLGLLETLDLSREITKEEYEKISNSISWKRPGELRKKPEMVSNGFSANDVSQFRLADCWFLAACSAVASNEKLMNHIVMDKETPLYGDGYKGGPYTFQFFFNGEWTKVSVDDRLPCIERPSKPVKLIYTSSSDDDEFWMALLEKAYAKLHGGYMNLNSGRSNNAMTELTGGISMRRTSHELRDDAKLLQFKLMTNDTRWYVCLGTYNEFPEAERDGKNRKNGIAPGHAYTVLGNVTFHYGTDDQEVTLFKLRNPWGHTEYTGEWGANDSKWKDVDPATKKSIGYEKDDDGVFFIEQNAIADVFLSVYICRVNPQFQQEHEIATGTWIRKEMDFDKYVVVKSSLPSIRVICSFLQCREGHRRIIFNYVTVSVFALECQEDISDLQLEAICANGNIINYESFQIRNMIKTDQLEATVDFDLPENRIVAITIDVDSVSLPETEWLVARLAADGDLDVKVLTRSDLNAISGIPENRI